jgi:uncharacterized protein (DUF1499 family)
MLPGHLRWTVAATLAMVISLSTAANPQTRESAIGSCPSKPNCVSSAEPDDSHYTIPFILAINATEGWKGIREAVAHLPRTTVIRESGFYLHAESRSRVFEFVDDLELELDESTGVVGVRSASRVGYSDLGVNRKRVKRLRKMLLYSGIIREN